MLPEAKEPHSKAANAVDASTLAELRERMREISTDLTEVAERRARSARRAAEAGADALRSTIRRQPALSLGAAALAGALLAVAVVPRVNRKARSGWRAWARSVPASRADLYEMANAIERALARAGHQMPQLPMGASFERMVDAITRMEPSSSLNSTLERAGAWLQNLRSRGAKAAGKDGG